MPAEEYVGSQTYLGSLLKEYRHIHLGFPNQLPRGKKCKHCQKISWHLSYGFPCLHNELCPVNQTNFIKTSWLQLLTICARLLNSNTL